jgi:hypothetical protein
LLSAWTARIGTPVPRTHGQTVRLDSTFVFIFCCVAGHVLKSYLLRGLWIHRHRYGHHNHWASVGYFNIFLIVSTWAYCRPFFYRPFDGTNTTCFLSQAWLHLFRVLEMTS